MTLSFEVELEVPNSKQFDQRSLAAAEDIPINATERTMFKITAFFTPEVYFEEIGLWWSDLRCVDASYSPENAVVGPRAPPMWVLTHFRGDIASTGK